VGHPAALVSYRFNGFLDDIYATLVVRLHHTMAFQSTDLWKSAADFSQSQRDSIIQPRVARHELPWVSVVHIHQP
jgi:hypothetical protein